MMLLIYVLLDDAVSRSVAAKKTTMVNQQKTQCTKKGVKYTTLILT